ncbi:TRI31 ligase, partial [Upupa epops]|nr:TRI31 ligase [Upupa epops]
ARVLEVAKTLNSLATARAPVMKEGCGKHQELLKFFCKNDGAFICSVCRESRDHRGHVVLPVPDAVQEYKDQIQDKLQTLKENRDKLLELRDAELRRSW